MTKFIADLRYPTTDPEINRSRWSQWSTLPMVEMSALDTYHFVRGAIKGSKQKILEVGCGNGYLSLEMARDGHEVTGLDLSEDAIQVAERGRDQFNLEKSTPGLLYYACADFNVWEAPLGYSFDVIVFNRSLHHVIGLEHAIAKAKKLLKEGGLIICQEYAYDRLDDNTAWWLHQTQRLLFLSGHYCEDQAQSAEAACDSWHMHARHHGLNVYEKMSLALGVSFHQLSFEWVPYLFVYIGNGLCNLSPEQGRAMITFLRDSEKVMIEKGLIQAVGFRFVGKSYDEKIK